MRDFTEGEPSKTWLFDINFRTRGIADARRFSRFACQDTSAIIEFIDEELKRHTDCILSTENLRINVDISSTHLYGIARDMIRIAKAFDDTFFVTLWGVPLVIGADTHPEQAYRAYFMALENRVNRLGATYRYHDKERKWNEFGKPSISRTKDERGHAVYTDPLI